MDVMMAESKEVQKVVLKVVLLEMMTVVMKEKMTVVSMVVR